MNESLTLVLTTAYQQISVLAAAARIADGLPPLVSTSAISVTSEGDKDNTDIIYWGHTDLGDDYSGTILASQSVPTGESILGLYMKAAVNGEIIHINIEY